MFTILVVEDDAPLQRMMSAFLGLNGFSVVGAANGEEALNAIDRVMPDLVIADVMMPVMDGWELTRELRRCYPRLPIMLVTARDTIEDKRTGFTSGRFGRAAAACASAAAAVAGHDEPPIDHRADALGLRFADRAAR